MTDMENIRRKRLALGWTMEFINLERRNYIMWSITMVLLAANIVLGVIAL